MHRFIDLHTHSTASDGTMSPTEVVYEAKKYGLSAISLTDHDTVSGLAEAVKVGEQIGVEVICGIEVNADYDGELHILGYFIDYKNPDLLEAIDQVTAFRGYRNAKMVQMLIDSGFDITAEEVCALKAGGALDNIGRIHMAKLLVQKGYFENVREVFAKELGTGCPAYYAKQLFSPGECIDLIHAAGGLAFLAHPYLIVKTHDTLLQLAIRLKNVGLDGIECIYTEHSPEFENICMKICDDLHLLKSGGSDFHAENKPHIAIGKTFGNKPIDYEILGDIKLFYNNPL